MDQEQGSRIPLHGSLRLSRLPTPRSVASSDNLKFVARKMEATPSFPSDELRKASNLPRPAATRGPLGETLNQSIRSRFGFSDVTSKTRSTSPIRDALRAAALDTTPPSSGTHPPVFEDGDENGDENYAGSNDMYAPVHTGRRRPRPSLSERTIETLSQVSPCPSPAQRRGSILSNDGVMAPPARSASSMRKSRPATPSASRSSSPTKQPSRLPGGRNSPTKDETVLSPVISPGNIYTPPKALVKDQRSRIAKPMRDERRSISSVFEKQPQSHCGRQHSKVSSQTLRVKPTYESRSLTPKAVSTKPSLASMFKDPNLGATEKSTKSGASGSETRSGLMKPRSRGENTIAPSTPPSTKANKSTKLPAGNNGDASPGGAKRSPNSSAALREAIAKAKSARKKALGGGASPTVSGAVSTGSDLGLEDDVVAAGDNKGLLRKRIQQAVSSGQLNIAAMSLSAIPPEVMKMYAADNSTVNWSEMVDLVKLIAADNEIEELGDEHFPDYTKAQLEDDDDKTNQFGGLEVLDLRRNRLQSIPIGLRRLERLHTLNLSNNKLTNSAIDILGQLPGLKELVLADNNLTGAFVFKEGQYSELQVLDLKGNQVEVLDTDTLTQLARVTKLNLKGNKLSRFPWEVLENLKLADLNISGNKFAGVLIEGISRSERLRNLDASQNALERFSEGDVALPRLEVLAVDTNNLVALPDLSQCSHLQTLTASENKLESLPPNFHQLRSLRNADFGHNNIKVIEAVVATMESLTSLTLVGNPLRERKYLTMGTPDLKVDLEKKLDSVEAGEGGSEALATGETNTTSERCRVVNGVLDLSSQNLVTVPISELALEDSAVPIHTVKLSNNDLTTFPVDLLSHPSLKYSIRSLDLSHNPHLHPTDYLTSELFLPSLKSLYIVSTGLTSLDALTSYLKAPALAELNISCHRLAGRVPWVRAWWPGCTTLLATDNWFTSVDLEGVRGLEMLDIRNNEIESLPPKIGLFGNLPGQDREAGRLRVLEVSGNRFRVPRLNVVEKGTEAVLRDLRRMVPVEEVPEEWQDAV